MGFGNPENIKNMKKCLHEIKNPIAFFGDTDSGDYPDVLILECIKCSERFYITEKRIIDNEE